MAPKLESAVDRHQDFQRVCRFITAVLLDDLTHHHCGTNLPLGMIVRVIDISIQKECEDAALIPVEPGAKTPSVRIRAAFTDQGMKPVQKPYVARIPSISTDACQVFKRAKRSHAEKML